MIYKKNVKNGDMLSILGFGCMRFPTSGGRVDEKQSFDMLMQAVEGGVNYFDTAWPYHGGQSEAILGKFLAEKNLRNDVFIATKLPIWICRSNKDFHKFFNKQLEKLRTDYIDYYLMHMLTSYDSYLRLCNMGLKEYLAELKSSGKARNVGFSYHGEKGDFIKIVDDYDWDFCQIQYNILDINNQAGKEGLLHASQKGMPVIIMEPLRGGSLVNNLPKKVVELIEKSNVDKSPVELFLSWVMNHKQATVVLSGMSLPEHVESNLKTSSAINDIIPENEQKLIDEVREVFIKNLTVPCTGCGYCIDCPQKIDIARCFEVYNKIMQPGFLGNMMYTMSSGMTLIKAKECIECGKCEKHCPQAIDIMRQLKIISKKPHVRILAPIANWYLNKRGAKKKK